MANRKLIVEIIGDDRSIQRAFNRSTTSATRFGVAVDNVNRKAGALGGVFGRGGGTLLGGAAAAAALKSLVSAAQEQEVVLGQTRVALEASGLDWEKYADRVEASSDRISKATSFDDEDVLRSFQTLIRSASGVDEALDRVRLAADVARGSYKDLAFGTQVVNKAALGQIGALRRLGIEIDKNATATEALTRLQQKFGGAAEEFSQSSAAATERLAVAFENLRETLGTNLLPLVADVATQLAGAAEGAERLVEQLERIGKVKIPGTGSDLFNLLEKLDFLNPAQAPLKLLGALGGGDGAKDGKKAIEEIGDSIQKVLNDAASRFKNVQDKAAGGGVRDLLETIDGLLASGKGAVSEAIALAARLETLDRNAQNAALAVDLLDLALQRASATPTLADDIDELQKMTVALERQEQAIRARIALSRDDAGLQQELISVQRRQIQNEQQLAEAVKQRTAALKAAAAAAEQAAQFRSLGLTAEGDKPIPTIENLRKQLEQLDAKIDSGRSQSILNRIRKVLTDPISKATEETRQAIRDMFAEIRGELDKGLEGPLTKTSGLNTKKIIEGLGLDAVTAAEIRSRLSGFNSAGRALAGNVPTGALSGAAFGATIVVENHNVTTLDGEVVARSVTRSQQKAGRRNPRQKRGPNRIGGV